MSEKRTVDVDSDPIMPLPVVKSIPARIGEVKRMELPSEPFKPSRNGDTDIAMCKTCQEFCTTGMPLCDKAKKEIGFDDSDIEPVKTEAIDAVIGFIFYFVGFLNDTLPKDKLAEYEEIAKRARAELNTIKGRMG
jgi:hypothetical protein